MLFLLTALLLLGARSLRIPARSTLFGITLGFAIYMLGKVLLDSIALQQVQQANVITRISGSVYLSSCLLWLLYAICGQELPPRPTVDALYHSSVPAPSLIDTINAMVERSMRGESKSS